MKKVLVFIFTLISVHENIIDTAIKRYEKVDSYEVTLQSTGDGNRKTIRYYFKKPGFVRMEFKGPHKGAVLVYNPHKNTVRIRPFDFLSFFILTLSPDNKIIRSSKGHRVNESDIGTLLQKVKQLQSLGSNKVLGDEMIGERHTTVVSVRGEGTKNVDGIYQYLLWLDRETLLPLKASSYNAQGALLEEVLMEDLHVNPDLSEGFFDL